MTDRHFCNGPDRDFPDMKCGYPLPCPYHTVKINLDSSPPSLTIPITADEALKKSRKLQLAEIAECLDLNN